MIEIILIILIVLWGMGYVNVPFLPSLNTSVITIFNHVVTLYDLFVFAVILWLIESLSYPLRELVSVVFVLWILSTLGVITFVGLPNIIVFVLILGLIIYLIKRKH